MISLFPHAHLWRYYQISNIKFVSQHDHVLSYVSHGTWWKHLQINWLLLCCILFPIPIWIFSTDPISPNKGKNQNCLIFNCWLNQTTSNIFVFQNRLLFHKPEWDSALVNMRSLHLHWGFFRPISFQECCPASCSQQWILVYFSYTLSDHNLPRFQRHLDQSEAPLSLPEILFWWKRAQI